MRGFAPIAKQPGARFGRRHTADRWIAAVAIRLGIPLVSNDGIFHGAPGLSVDSQLAS